MTGIVKHCVARGKIRRETLRGLVHLCVPTLRLETLTSSDPVILPSERRVRRPLIGLFPTWRLPVTLLW